MAAKIGSLVIDVSANVAKITKDMGKIQKNVSKASKGMSNAIASVKTVMAGLFTGYVLNQAISFGKAIIDDADALSKLAQKTGVSVESLSALEYAAKLSGASIGSVAIGMKTLAKNATDASTGIGEAKDTFNKLGVSVVGANGKLKSVDRLILEVSDAMGKLETATEKSAAAQRIFGKSGTDLLPMLNKGADGIKEMTDEAERLGIVVSTDFAKSAEEANDALERLDSSFKGLAREAMPEIVTAGTKLVETLQEVLQASRDLKNFKPEDTMDAVQGTLIDLAKRLTLIGFITEGYKELNKSLSDVNETINNSPMIGDDAGTSNLMKLFEDGAKAAETRMKTLLEDSQRLADALAEQAAAFAQLDKVTDNLFDDAGFESAAEGLRMVEDALQSVVSSGYWEELEEAIKGPAAAASAAFDEAVKAYDDAMEKVQMFSDAFANYVTNMTDGTEQKFSDMVSGILKSLLRLQAQRFFVNMFSGGMQEPTRPKLSGYETPIPMFASGGVVTSPTLALAGEAGDEVFFPLKNVGGKMGISGSGGGSTVVNIINNSSASVRTERRTGPDGVEQIDAYIVDKMCGAVDAGALDGSMRSSFGIERQGFGR